MKRLVSVFVLVALGLAAGWLYRSLHEPYAGFSQPVIFSIEPGTGSLEMAGLLRRHRVIRHEWEFLIVRLLRPKATLQAGEYRFAEPASVWTVYDRIARGDVFYYSVVVPEGSNLFDVARILSRLDWIRREDVLKVVRDPSLIRDLDPKAQSLEGYLFPSTYRVSRAMSPPAICRMMTQEFRAVWRRIGDGADVHETVTLASLVEKETSIPAERPLVASVYRNRLKRGIRLECDPTVIYAALLEGDYRGVIHQSDLARRNPYNTYVYAGLPPGPIASPGRAALEAALHPATTEYLYFVAKGDGSGTHEFSRSLAAHLRAVRRYRRAIRQARRHQPAARVPRPKKAGDN